jgi:hypothetical protein
VRWILHLFSKYHNIPLAFNLVQIEKKFHWMHEWWYIENNIFNIEMKEDTI